jgi:hypothetical protein
MGVVLDDGHLTDAAERYVDEVLFRLQELDDTELGAVADELSSKLAGIVDPDALLGPPEVVADELRVRHGLRPWDAPSPRPRAVKVAAAVVALALIATAALAWTRFLAPDDDLPLSSPGAAVSASDAARLQSGVLVVDLVEGEVFDVEIALINVTDAPVTLLGVGDLPWFVLDSRVVPTAEAGRTTAGAFDDAEAVPLSGHRLDPGARVVLAVRVEVVACGETDSSQGDLLRLVVRDAGGEQVVPLLSVLARGVGCGVPSSV